MSESEASRGETAAIGFSLNQEVGTDLCFRNTLETVFIDVFDI